MSQIFTAQDMVYLGIYSEVLEKNVYSAVFGVAYSINLN